MLPFSFFAIVFLAGLPAEMRIKMQHKTTAWNLIDEVLTEMTDTNFGFWATDRIKFRDILIEELKDYIVREGVILSDEVPERDERTGEWL